MLEAWNKTETEIKLPASDPQAALGRIESARLRLVKERTFESNLLFDTPDASLRRQSQVLRLRQSGEQCLLTFKGAPLHRRHKVREEIEIQISGIDAMKVVLERLGFLVSFRYEKYRTEFGDDEGIVTMDETPIGNYLELEGPAGWIDAMARNLGYPESEYITKSYGRLYLEYCQRTGIEPSHMVF